MSKYSLPKKEAEVSEENALKQMMLFLIRYDVNIDNFKGDEQETIKRNNDKFLECIMDGRLQVEEIDGEVKITQFIKHQSKNSNVEKLVYREVKGADKEEMEQGANEHKRMNQLMGAVCETPGGHSAVRQLRTSDRKAMETIAVYFL